MNPDSGLRSTVFAAVMLVVLLGAGVCAGTGDSGVRLKVMLPDDMDPARVQVHYLCGSSMGTLGGREPLTSREFSIPPATYPGIHSTEAVKVYAYCPGYQIAWAVDPNISEPWKPQFVKAVTAKLEGTLTDPNGQPAVGKEICFSYTMAEDGGFHGSRNGLVSRLMIAIASVGPDGKFETQLPVFDADPFMEKYGLRKQTRDGRPGPLLARRAEIMLAEWEAKGSQHDGPLMLQPDFVTLQPKYDVPLEVKMTSKPRISGRIGELFRKNNGIAGTPSFSGQAKDGEVRAVLYAEAPGRPVASSKGRVGKATVRGRNCELKADWSFSVVLEPGVYDIVLREYGQGFRLNKQTVIKGGVVVGNGSDVKIDIP
jgi:hypothetical protein